MNPDPTSLDRLHDLVAPGPVPFWPPAPGWYWLLAFAVAGLLVATIHGFIRWQHNRYRREALAELSRQEAYLHSRDHRGNALVVLAELMKRTAVTAWPRRGVANLTGPEWFAFLDRADRTTSFRRGDGAILERAAYDPRTAADVDNEKASKLMAEIHHWIRHHDTRISTEDNEGNEGGRNE
jgi:hypothetical protein